MRSLHKTHFVVISLVLMTGGANETLAQANEVRLNLFEPVAASEQSAPVEAQPAAPVFVPANNPQRSAPQFTLIGTSQFGNNRSVRLRNPQGQTVTVRLDSDGRGLIPDHPGYSVEESQNRQLLIRHPDGDPCFGAPAQGVVCQTAQVSRLSLATAAPVRRAPSPANAPAAQTESAPAPTSAEAGPENNPFASALRAARERVVVDEAVMRAEAERFRPRRIDPSEVPPGSRLVRTPFGDRIISDEQ